MSSYRVKGGMVLVMMIWLITIMSVFGLGLARISYANYRYAKFRADRLLSSYALEAVVAMCKYNRIEDESPGYDSLAELPQEEEYTCGSVKVVYSLIDEERFINVNKANSLTLRDLPGMNMDKALEITSSTYRPFKVKEVLLLVDEIDEEVYNEMKDFVTIYGYGRININTCSEDTLIAMGMDDNLIELIIDYRKGEDDELYTSDDRIFEIETSIIDNLKEEFYLSLSEQQDLIAFMGKNAIDVKSGHYRIVADVYVSEKLIDRYTIVIGEEKRKHYVVKEWRQS